MKKYALFLCIILIYVLSPIALADTVNLYANIDDSSTQCNMLIDAMRSDSEYDPFNEYVVCRAGEYDYRIYFGPDLEGDNLIYYQYTPPRSGAPARIQRGTASSLNINKNGFYCVGNTEGNLASSQEHSYKLGAVLVICAIFVVILILFRIFRKSEGRKTKYYSVR